MVLSPPLGPFLSEAASADLSDLASVLHWCALCRGLMPPCLLPLSVWPMLVPHLCLCQLETTHCFASCWHSNSTIYMTQYIWGPRFSSIVGFRSLNFAQSYTLVYWNRINQHFGFSEKKYREMEFRPLENESSPFCRTEWFHIHVKIAFIHLSVWLIGEGGKKFRRRRGFDSSLGRKVSLGWKLQILQFFYFLKTWNFNPSFNRTYLTASFRRFAVLA